MSKEEMDTLMNSDLYKLIGVLNTASIPEIKKAYRKKALSCHPDKHPDNPRAAELFHDLSRALEILTDKSARAAYDKVINAKYQAELRVKEYDAKRKKLKDDLEAREEAYKRSLSTVHTSKTHKDKLQAEIERLRTEGSKQLEEEIALMKKKLDVKSRQYRTESEIDTHSYKIKIKWKSSKTNSTDNGYDYDTLHRMLSKYGDVAALVISSSREGRALVEYRNRKDAETALNTEVGLTENPLRLEKLWDTTLGSNCTDEGRPSNGSRCTERASQGEVYRNAMSDAEFEFSVLNSLRKAEERKRSFGGSSLGEGT